ncbi:hypothetical protein E4U30_000767 [Claviceps sp. LM220 group G6]|nr:hypothetical protein E4U15_003747 [Claviceps sp. LM218 group G6]KAG6097344.1 hypothetical protein E4U30_000767 [Claviceps sp. LM220 group G6]KAG6102988.1 hypothetical protein E4U31_003173 [Claviceps sp. LM219 group G6]
MAGGMYETLLHLFAVRQKKNEQTTLAFIVALIGLGLVFSSFHLIRQFSHWFRRRYGRSMMPYYLVAVPRTIRKWSLRRVVGVPSLGHASVVTIYFVVNVVCLFVNMDRKGLGTTTNIASRSGWLATANLLFVIFFALKNTPLAFLTAWSYERLNCLHRVCGYGALVHTIIHASCYSYYFTNTGQASILLRTSDIMGIVAGGSWVLLVLAAIFIRPWWYELFYYLHVILWVVSLITLGLHRPDLSSKVAIGTVVAGAMWGMDRLIRLVRMVFYTVNNTATLTPLSNGGTRVTLAKPPVGGIPGKHTFLWIPQIRLFQTHPFTIASAEPLEFVIASRDGFTGALHKYAVANPGVRLRASIEGPYGTLPDASAFETVVLIAGGSGASFIFGLAQALLRTKATNHVVTQKVVFVWIVKHNSQLEWFSDHFITLRNDPRFSVQVFVTRSSPPPPPLAPLRSDTTLQSQDEEKKGPRSFAGDDYERRQHLHAASSDSSIDLEKSSPPSDGESTLGADADPSIDEKKVLIEYQRPDIPGLIREVVGEAAAQESILIAGCGPGKLMDVMRETTADCIRWDGPSIELHCEKYGW